MQSQNPPAAGPLTFTDRMRAQSKGLVEAVAGFFNRAGISPDAMTLLGLMGSALGAILLALGAVPLSIRFDPALGDRVDGKVVAYRSELLLED